MSFPLIANLIGYQVKYAVWIDWCRLCGGFNSRAEAHEYAKDRGHKRYTVKAE